MGLSAWRRLCNTIHNNFFLDVRVAFIIIQEIFTHNKSTNKKYLNKKERKATALMRLTINEGSFKSRSGGPNEDPEDMALPVWHGQVPVCPYHPAS